MSEYKIGEEVLVKATIVKDYDEDCAVRIGKYLPELVKKYDIITCPIKTYEDGLNEAWELARSVLGMNVSDLRKIFGVDWTFPKIMSCSPLEVTEKVKTWEEEKEIRVNDVVRSRNDGLRGLVVMISKSGDYYVKWQDGRLDMASKDNLTKTGRTVDVCSLLAEIGEEG